MSKTVTMRLNVPVRLELDVEEDKPHEIKERRLTKAGLPTIRQIEKHMSSEDRNRLDGKLENADVTGEMKQAFGVEAETREVTNGTEYRVACDCATITLTNFGYDPNLWVWEVKSMNKEGTSGNADTPTAAIDAAKDAAQDLLTSDLERMED